MLKYGSATLQPKS